MKKIFQKSMLLLCALIVGSSSVWAGDTFVKVTSTDDLVSGDVYIIATSSAVATAYSSGSLTTTSSGFTESSGTITTTTAKPMEFTLGKEGNNYTLKMSDGRYLGYNSSTNFRRTESSSTDSKERWTIESNNTYSLYTIVNVATNTRFIGSGYEVFKVYAEMANNPPATLYKKLVGDDSEVTFEDKTPSIDYPGTTTYSQVPTTATGYMDETGAAISYEITANTAGATINVSTGLVTVAHGGTVTVKATAAAIEGKFKSSNDSYTLTVNDNRAEAPISFSSSTAEATMGEDFVAPTLNNDEGLSVSYSSDNEAVATVNDATGLVTLVAPGTTNIIATFAGNATYKNTAVQYTLTVNKGAQTLPYEESFINYSFGDFTSDGVNYDNISIWNATSESIRATSDIGNVNRNAESWLTSPVIDATNVTHIALSFQQAINKYFGTIANEAMVYAKNVGDADWTKLAITYPSKPSDGYSDFLTTTVDLSDFAGKKLQIAFVYKGATTAAGTWKVKNLKISVSAEDITISAAGLATYVSDYDLDFTNVENLEAYYATQSGSTVELHQVNKIAAGTGVLLRAKNNATNFEVPVTTAAADATTGNIFVRGTGAAVATTTDGKYNWILSKKSGVVGFYHANGNTVAKNRAYLQTTVASARIDLNFEDVTAIDEVRGEMSDVRGGLYDLQGRNVQSLKLSKGLYIVNGKKVMVK